MIRRVLLGALVLAAVPWLAWADDAVEVQGPPAPASDVQDVVFLRGPAPVLLRLHIEVDGKSFAAAWDEYMDTLFAYLDVDGDGVLSKEEAARVPTAQSLVPNNGGRALFLGQQVSAARFSDLDVNPTDGKITRAKLAAYYRRNGLRPLQVMVTSGGGQADALTEVLFKALDRDKDGKLTKDKLLRAGDALRKFDLDEDEIITLQELLPNPAAFGLQQPQSVPAGPGAAAFAIEAKDGGPALADALLRAYDRDKNGKLSREEIGLEKAIFDKLDTNGDGELDATELARFGLLPPDGEFVVRIGKGASRETPIELFGPRGKEGPLGGSAKKTASGLAVTLGIAQLELRRAEAQAGGFNGINNVRQFFTQQFRAADTKKQGFLEKKDLQGQAQQFFGSLFTFADRDGDGKLTQKELNEWFDMQDRAVTSRTVLTVSDQGRGLFDALDANRDGRLTLQELSTAWDRVSAWDRTGKGYITRADIPGSWSLTVGQGQPTNNGRIVMRLNPAPGPVAPRSTKGPLWFRKMDRNGDGVVSRSEWLGSLEDFKRFDLNGDGLIDLEEAEKADAEMRKDGEAKDR